MECEKVREKFSSLLEGDLSPSEERSVTDHLASCTGCQKDFETFKRTMNWLHLAEELEAPKGFLTEIYQRIEGPKRMGGRQGWIHRLSRMNLPAQAVAMVAIVFAVLYITKTIPIDTSSFRKVDKPLADYAPLEKRAEGAIAKKEAEDKKTAEQKKAEPGETSMEELKPPSPEEKRADSTMLAKETPSPASISVPVQEIVLRTSDPGKSLSELQAMVKQFGGEVIKKEENVLLASLPTGSLSEFRKELEERSFSKSAEVPALQREAPRALKLAPKAKEEVGRKEREMGRPVVDEAGRVTVRILLMDE